MRIAVSGSRGLIGSALLPALAAAGHEALPIRRDGGPGIAWDGGEAFDAAALRRCDAVVHLAGASIAGRWTARARAAIRDSRVRSTAALARLLAEDPGAVRTLVVASAIGWYGDRGDERLDEDSPPGRGFLAEVCQAWEAAADPCRARVRAVHLRFGMVLAAHGGALARMLTAARLGLAGRLGSGRQWWSWIALDDAVRLVLHALADEGLAGPVNAVSPEPVRQADFAHALARALGRPAWGPPAPRWALRLMLGEMADGLLLASARVLPACAERAGFRWQLPELPEALAALLR